jgi:serine protease Do
MKPKHILLIVAVSSLTSLGSYTLYQRFTDTTVASVESEQKVPVHYADYRDLNRVNTDQVDFTKAAAIAVPAVVHIKTRTAARKVAGNKNIDIFLGDVFGNGMVSGVVPEQRASGSGVIISGDGYIVTNEHVLTDATGTLADEINVTLNSGKTFKAKLVGKDAVTDVALLKIESERLPYLNLMKTPELQTGQWVLAVGYPLSLQTTVTAGIISATGSKPTIGTRQVRSREETARTFIQTDAAVNTGSSGGALMNTNGELIGITSGIVSPNGTYAGYSFAIPVIDVKKAVKKILESSEVQKGS